MAQLLWKFIKPEHREGLSRHLVQNAGLLHNIGLIITDLRLGTFSQQAGVIIRRESNMKFHEALRKSLGLTQQPSAPWSHGAGIYQTVW